MIKKPTCFFAAVAIVVFLFILQPSAADASTIPAGMGKSSAPKTGSPARFILTLDNSASMCREVTKCAGATNNDPMNKRVAGATVFVDSVAKKCPQCEIGVIVYLGIGSDTTQKGRTVWKSLQAIKLNNANNIISLHNLIDSARCSMLAKTIKAGNLAKKAITWTGVALDSAIKMVDAGYDTIGNRMERHIILLTDGEWQGRKPAEAFAAYAAQYPQRPLPVIHGVFISDSATHVAYGFPPQGMISCDTLSLEKEPVNLSFLQSATQTTGGLFFPGSTPQTIVATFDSLVDVFALSSSRASAVPVEHFLKGGGAVVAVFDMCGKRLNKSPGTLIGSAIFDYRGVYFVKYLNGMVERRVNPSKKMP